MTTTTDTSWPRALVHARSLLLGLALGGLASSLAIAAGPKIPTAVERAIGRLLDGGHTKIEAEASNGGVVYEAAIQTELEITVDATGRLRRVEVEVPIGLTPRAVLDSARRTLPASARIEEAELLIENGRLAYEIEAKTGEDEVALSIAPDGGLLAEETESADDDDDDDD